MMEFKRRTPEEMAAYFAVNLATLQRQRDAAIRGWHRDLVRANLFADEATDEISQAIGMEPSEVARILEVKDGQ